MTNSDRHELYEARKQAIANEFPGVSDHKIDKILSDWAKDKAGPTVRRADRSLRRAKLQ